MRLAEMVDSGATYEDTIRRFTSIGTEARALLRAMIAERRSELEG